MPKTRSYITFGQALKYYKRVQRTFALNPRFGVEYPVEQSGQWLVEVTYR